MYGYQNTQSGWHLTDMIIRAGSRIFRRGAWTHFGRFWPPTWALFSENVCENERIGSCRGGGVRRARPPLDPPMIMEKEEALI